MPARVTPADPPARRVPTILRRLRAAHPAAECALQFDTPFQLLAATILSAQCTDARVNKTTPALFAAYPDAPALAAADPAEVERLVKSCGFYRTKAKNLVGTAAAVVGRHGGELPRSADALAALPGVGRKTANVVLGVAFGRPAGVVVDTHVGRLARRLGLTAETDAAKVERDLNALIPKSRWVTFPLRTILHGRAVCTARRARCGDCVLAGVCPKVGVEESENDEVRR